MCHLALWTISLRIFFSLYCLGLLDMIRPLCGCSVTIYWKTMEKFETQTVAGGSALETRQTTYVFVVKSSFSFKKQWIKTYPDIVHFACATFHNISSFSQKRNDYSHLSFYGNSCMLYCSASHSEYRFYFVYKQRARVFIIDHHAMSIV